MGLTKSTIFGSGGSESISSGGANSVIFSLHDREASSISSSAPNGDVIDVVGAELEGLSLVLISSSDTRTCCREKISLTSLETSARKWASWRSWCLFAASHTSYLLRWINPLTTARENQL